MIKEYNSQNIRPTLRQIHYRLTSEQAGGYENTEACYKGLSKRLVEARTKGLISWNALADHVRHRWWIKPKVDMCPMLETARRTDRTPPDGPRGGASIDRPGREWDSRLRSRNAAPVRSEGGKRSFGPLKESGWDRIRSAPVRPDVIVVSALPPNKGRLSEYGFKLVEGLAEGGLRVKVLSDVRNGGTARSPNLRVERVWTPDDPLSLLKIPFAVARSRGKVALFNIHFAVFGRSRLVNFLGFICILITSLLSRLFDFKTMIILHNLPDTIDMKCFGMKPSFPNRLGFFLAEKMALSCDRIVVTTQLNREIVRRRFRKEAFYIPHGAWNDLKASDRTNGRRDSLLFLGYMSPSKDMELLARVFRRLKERHVELKLKLVTSEHPNFPGAIKQLEAFDGMKDVENLGYVEDKDLPSIFCSCLAVVLPYRTATGSSGVLHLVSASGLPVVATDHAEFREEREQGAGLLLAASEDEMVRALEKLIADENEWISYSERSKRFSKERSWAKISAVFRELIVEIAKTASS